MVGLFSVVKKCGVILRRSRLRVQSNQEPRTVGAEGRYRDERREEGPVHLLSVPSADTNRARKAGGVSGVVIAPQGCLWV